MTLDIYCSSQDAPEHMANFHQETESTERFSNSCGENDWSPQFENSTWLSESPAICIDAISSRIKNQEDFCNGLVSGVRRHTRGHFHSIFRAKQFTFAINNLHLDCFPYN